MNTTTENATATKQARPKAKNLEECETAFVSKPARITEDVKPAIRRAYSHLRVYDFESSIKTKGQWSKQLGKHLSEFDCFITVTDDSRELSKGVLRELRTALALNKWVSVFNVSTMQAEIYRGYDIANGVVKLRTEKRKERS